MNLMMLHVFSQHVQLEKAPAAESQATTLSKCEIQRFVICFDDFQSEKGACGQSQRQQTHGR